MTHEITSILAKEWKVMSDQDKKPYNDIAKEERIKFNEKHDLP